MIKLYDTIHASISFMRNPNNESANRALQSRTCSCFPGSTYPAYSAYFGAPRYRNSQSRSRQLLGAGFCHKILGPLNSFHLRLWEIIFGKSKN